MDSEQAGPSGSPSWREIVRSERRRVRLTQRELGRRAGIDGETVRKYENGSRLATRENLDRIFEVLQSSEGMIHRALTDRGFFHPNTRFPLDRSPQYYFTVDELSEFVDRVRWPVFCANELGEIVAANRAFEALLGIDLDSEVARRGRARANLLVAMCEPRFASRLVNWDEILRLFIAINKAVPASRTMLDNPGVLFDEIVGAIGAVNPAALGRIFKLWTDTPPAAPKVRWMYPVVWREPDIGDLHFQGVVNTASEPESVAFNDWIPLDAPTWSRFEAILERHNGGD